MENKIELSPGLHMCAGCGLELVIRVVYRQKQSNRLLRSGYHTHEMGY